MKHSLGTTILANLPWRSANQYSRTLSNTIILIEHVWWLTFYTITSAFQTNPTVLLARLAIKIFNHSSNRTYFKTNLLIWCWPVEIKLIQTTRTIILIPHTSLTRRITRLALGYVRHIYNRHCADRTVTAVAWKVNQFDSTYARVTNIRIAWITWRAVITTGSTDIIFQIISRLASARPIFRVEKQTLNLIATNTSEGKQISIDIWSQGTILQTLIRTRIVNYLVLLNSNQHKQLLRSCPGVKGNFDLYMHLRRLNHQSSVVSWRNKVRYLQLVHIYLLKNVNVVSRNLNGVRFVLKKRRSV